MLVDMTFRMTPCSHFRLPSASFGKSMVWTSTFPVPIYSTPLFDAMAFLLSFRRNSGKSLSPVREKVRAQRRVYFMKPLLPLADSFGSDEPKAAYVKAKDGLQEARQPHRRLSAWENFRIGSRRGLAS